MIMDRKFTFSFNLLMLQILSDDSIIIKSNYSIIIIIFKD